MTWQSQRDDMAKLTADMAQSTDAGQRASVVFTDKKTSFTVTNGGVHGKKKLYDGCNA